LFFEEFTIGKRFESEARVVRQEDIVEFAELTGDLNPLHVDDKYASKTIFGRTIAHGLFTLGIALGQWYSENLTRDSIVAFVGLNNLSFLAPVYPGDMIRLRSEVLTARVSNSRPGVGIVTFKDQMVNQNEVVVLKFERSLMLRMKNA